MEKFQKLSVPPISRRVETGNRGVLALLLAPVLLVPMLIPALALAEDITLDNLVRAETDHMIRANIEAFGLEVGELVHQRETVDLDRQPVIRMNVDTIHLGACDDGRVSCIPITPGWSYAVRMYQPHEEIINGSWTFPALELAN